MIRSRTVRPGATLSRPAAAVVLSVMTILLLAAPVAAAGEPLGVIVDPDVGPSNLWIPASGTGGDVANDVAVDSAGTAYVCGQQQSATHGFDGTLVKISASGLAWTSIWDGHAHADDFFYAVAGGSHNVVYTAGTTTKADGTRDMVVVKWSSGGDVLWSRRYSGPVAGNDGTGDVVVDSRGNVVVCGASLGGPGLAFTAVSWTPDGERRWVYRSYGEDAGDTSYGRAEAMAAAGSGVVYVVGTAEGRAGIGAAHVVKLSSRGTSLWTRSYEGGDGAAFEDTVARRGGGVYVCGWTFDGVEGVSDGLVARYSASGGRLLFDWPASRDVTFRALAVAPGGTLCAAGKRTVGGTDDFRYRVLYNAATGAVISGVAWPRTHDEEIVDVAADDFGGVYLVGTDAVTAAHTAIVTWREPTITGGSMWTGPYGGDVVGLHRPEAIATWKSTAWVVGSVVRAGSGRDQVVLKYLY